MIEQTIPTEDAKDLPKKKKAGLGYGKILKDGIVNNNPVIVQTVGLCSVLGVSTSLANGIGMGVAVIVVLTLSNVVISLLRNFIPDKVRIPSYIVVIATFVTLVQMLLQAYIPALYNSLGLFIPLIVVNCIILARAEGFASKNGVVKSFVDGIGNGIGYTLVICILSIIRELIGAGELLGNPILPDGIAIGLVGQAPGAFIILGMLFALFNYVKSRGERRGGRA
ncbi:MAG: electron transport complex subunit E [Gallicola sp.]|nr:electron transport complex subunit E [Gallicola sp.]